MDKQNRPQSELAGFYTEWSSKSAEAIDFDIRSAERKADAIARLIPRQLLDSLHSLLDFGCGYGAVIQRLQQLRGNCIDSALGLDFSETAINVARARCDSEAIRYQKLPALDVRDNAAFLRTQVEGGVDAILLIDLLEHVPDCRALIAELAPLTRLFLIKLPVESSLFDNYLLPKEYPGSKHSNGHLREFDANNVHYFIRSLGLTPVFETLYRYDIEDSFPPMPPGTPLKRRLVRLMIRSVKTVLSWLLPTRIFLRVVGGGGYLCLASYNEHHVLNP
ncbi:class I SAM-dependent methyltransferase [Sphingorhabdus sp.]|uniref:class I SAM-dependent methyltransferase n=1 Tax=Sphingorhabdus sp. TaxID=1902408 RepID=UPI0035B2D08A